MKELIEKAKKHNEEIDNYINVTLKEHFGSDSLNMNQWFEAQEMIQSQNFYKKGMAILEPLRALGVDVKMNMQSNKLSVPYEYTKPDVIQSF